MLYPKEDRNTNKLMFACRTCQFSEEAQSSCVFRNNMYNTVGETAGVTQDVGSDPTVGDPSVLVCCVLCGAEIEDQFCGLNATPNRVGEQKSGTKESAPRVFDLTEMSQMEEEDEEGNSEIGEGLDKR